MQKAVTSIRCPVCGNLVEDTVRLKAIKAWIIHVTVHRFGARPNPPLTTG